MKGNPLVDFTFDAEPERTLHIRLRQARQARLDASEAETLDSKKEKEIEVSKHSNTESDKEREDSIVDEPQERFLGDYGGENAQLGRLTIVNQLVNVPNFQLHPTTIRQLEKRSFTWKINEDAIKHLQRFLTMSTTWKIEGNTEEVKKLRMFSFTLVEVAEE